MDDAVIDDSVPRVSIKLARLAPGREVPVGRVIISQRAAHSY